MGDKSNYKHYENISIMLQMDTLTFEAESVAYMVCELLGFDTSEYSFGYISGWSKDKEVPELKEHLNLIKKCTEEIYEKIYEGLEQLKEQAEDETAAKAHHR